MHLEILHGPASYSPENLARADHSRAHGPHSHRPIGLNGSVTDDAMPEPRGEYSELYSTKHERLLLRVDHITTIDAIRKGFNNRRIHLDQRALTTSEVVNACLDFVFEHRIPFHGLTDADDTRRMIGEHVYRSAVSRWRQLNEHF